MSLDLFKEAKENWQKPWGLIVATIGTASFGYWLYQQQPKSLTQIIVVTSIAITLIGCKWLFDQRPPRIKKNKIGLVIALSCSEADVKKQIREDFIENLRELLSAGESGKKFQLLELPDRFSDNIKSEDDAKEIQRQTNARFVIYGRVRLRQHKGAPHHFIDMRGIVSHAPLHDTIQKKFQNEFTELLPAKINFPKDSDLLHFEFTSELAEIVARYIIGLASYLSGHLDIAEQIYTDAERRLKKVKKNFPSLQKIRNRLPTRQYEIHHTRALRAYHEWQRNRSPSLIEQLESHLKKIPENTAYESNVVMLRCICGFLSRKNTKAARYYINTKQDKNNAVWHFNNAFLEAWDGNLTVAMRFYRTGAALPLEPAALGEIEEFLVWAVTQFPDKAQLRYCLAYFNLKVKGDAILAISDFKSFIDSHCEEKFPLEYSLAKKQLEKLEADRSPSQQGEQTDLKNAA